MKLIVKRLWEACKLSNGQVFVQIPPGVYEVIESTRNLRFSQNPWIIITGIVKQSVGVSKTGIAKQRVDLSKTDIAEQGVGVCKQYVLDLMAHPNCPEGSPVELVT